MSARGRHVAAIIAILIVLFLPKRVECTHGERCSRTIPGGRTCSAYEIEPLMFYALERLLDRDIGFAYSSGEDCR
ncbi:MAG: hypothetical protein KF773_11730 [Deltaproteobacteria bacterium]|nr:hypothetical protein [Deltaproteobacteria bacterium]